MDTRRQWFEVPDVRRIVRKRREEMKNQYVGPLLVDKWVSTANTIHHILKYEGEFSKYLAERAIQDEIHAQTFMQDRVDILGPDLAAAHFVISRGGSVRFWRDSEWYNLNNPRTKLPRIYIPGYYVEGINLFGTKLLQEGLESLRQLNKLKWLSLKGLEHLNDFAVDFISGHYGQQLEYLNLADCKGITHYGLCCFYRFKNLKFLNLSGIEQSHEFKLACLMIEDLLPNIQIKGVDYSDYMEDTDETIESVETVKTCDVPSVKK